MLKMTMEIIEKRYEDDQTPHLEMCKYFNDQSDRQCSKVETQL